MTKKYDSKRKEPMVQEASPEYIRRKAAGEYTLEDYYALPDEKRVELIDGAFYDMASPTILHQLIILEIYDSFREFVRRKKKPCLVLVSPVDVQLDCDDRTIVQPDLLVVCSPEKNHMRVIYGAPDFILEVLSRSSRKKDMTIKVNKYRNAGVREYWMFDPEKRKLMIYNFMENEEIYTEHELYEIIPAAISGGELCIDLSSVRELVQTYDADKVRSSIHIKKS